MKVKWNEENCKEAKRKKSKILYFLYNDDVVALAFRIKSCVWGCCCFGGKRYSSSENVNINCVLFNSNCDFPHFIFNAQHPGLLTGIKRRIKFYCVICNIDNFHVKNLGNLSIILGYLT